MNKDKILQAIKISVVSVLAILAATVLHLKFATTAGIITILSLQNTKRETLKLAKNRVMAYISALFIAWFCYQIIGFTIVAFAIYLLLFSFVCLYLGWPESIAMISVLMIHFLNEGTMNKGIIMNETLLFVIGTGFGVFTNLYLKRKTTQFNLLADKVDAQMKYILLQLSSEVLSIQSSSCKHTCFRELDTLLVTARKIAIENQNNSLLTKDASEEAYITLRQKQTIILKHICSSITMISSVPKQAQSVSNLLLHIRSEYHKENTAKDLLAELELIFEKMKQEELPKVREEFESRALLFYLLKQIQEFLELKQEYSSSYM